METVIKGRTPERLFRFFEEISAIPRESGHEGLIADYLERFATERGLEVFRDPADNVLIRMRAGKGYEEKPPVLLQGHVDMVCEKRAGTEHDFGVDPIRLKTDGKFLFADGTTLGGDDGIAAAVMLALLDGESPEHPALECLFTAGEEIGLVGAKAFDYRQITARRGINLDSGRLGVITAGCAGGVRSDLSARYTPCAFKGQAVSVRVEGLAGGHSGEEIHRGLANAILTVGKMLEELSRACEVHVISLSGGGKDNAIPRECEAVVAVPDADFAVGFLTDAAESMMKTFVPDDRGAAFRIEESDAGEGGMLPKETGDALLSILATVPNGVFSMTEIPGLVEYSRNLGSIRCGAGDLTLTFLTRSAKEAQLDASQAELESLAKRFDGMTVSHRGRYFGWDYCPVSGIRSVYQEVFRDVTGREANVEIIHAGLECGILSGNLPGLDMISVGPDLYDIHTPDERLDLDSTESFWKTIAETLKRL